MSLGLINTAHFRFCPFIALSEYLHTIQRPKLSLKGRRLMGILLNS